MKKTLKAKEEFFYDGRTRKVGEKFTAVDPDANILVCLNKAEESTPDPVVAVEAAPVYEAKVVTAEEPEESPPRRRRYMRRDMTAEKS